MSVVEVIYMMIILMVVTAFLFFCYVEFIKPTVLQIQLLGIHLTIVGGFLLLYEAQTIGMVSMLLGLAIGIYGSFKNSNVINQTDESQKEISK